MRARRRARERDRLAARALQPRQQPLGHLPGHLDVKDLRPPRARDRRAGQRRLAPAALHRRIRWLRLVRVRVPGQAHPRMPGLPARLAVLAPVPFRFLPLAPPRLAPLACPDALLRRRRPGVGSVLIQPPFQLCHPQFQPPPQLPLRVQPRPQHPDPGVLRLDHGPQPDQQLTLLPAPGRQIRQIRHIRHIRHKPRSCSTSPASSSARHDVSPQPHARDHPANGHKDSPERGCRILGGRSWAW